MIRILAALSAVTVLSATPAFAGEAALVTLSSGDVKLKTAAAPAAPFVLDEGATLELGDGATVVVLHEGTATRLRGPRTVGLKDLHAASTGATTGSRAALSAVISRDVSFAKAGASRGDDLQLQRPIPGGTVLAPQGFSWRCDGCGTQDVAVYDFMADTVAWSGKGDGSVAYAGPDLKPGPYLVRIGAREFSFTVADGAAQERVKQARAAADEARQGLKQQGVSDVAALVSIPAGVYLRSGLPSEALWLVDAELAAHPDDAALKDLRADYERQAGLAQP